MKEREGLQSTKWTVQGNVWKVPGSVNGHRVWALQVLDTNRPLPQTTSRACLYPDAGGTLSGEQQETRTSYLEVRHLEPLLHVPLLLPGHSPPTSAGTYTDAPIRSLTVPSLQPLSSRRRREAN
ncbi:hypothetical protein Q8A73_016718 [Channa argus]|nr:hypothetical protein Q8A73_016718 [Channa argus]